MTIRITATTFLVFNIVSFFVGMVVMTWITSGAPKDPWKQSVLSKTQSIASAAQTFLQRELSED